MPMECFLPLLYLLRPAFNALTLAANLETIDLHAAHARCVVKPARTRHASRVRALLRRELEHGREEIGHLFSFLILEVILFVQHIRQGPMPQTVDIPQLALAVEYLLRPFPRETKRFGKWPKQFADLCYMIIVFAIFGTRLRVKEVIARDQLKDLYLSLACDHGGQPRHVVGHVEQ